MYYITCKVVYLFIIYECLDVIFLIIFKDNVTNFCVMLLIYEINIYNGYQ
jgi:hypothetical protein